MFQDGVSNPFTGVYDGTQDASLRAGNSRNYGGDTLFSFGGGFSAILKFDLSSMSALDVTVNSAVLALTPRVLASGSPIAFSIYSLNSVNAGWNQGTGANVASTPGEVSWSYLSYQDRLWENDTNFSASDYAASPLYTGSFDPLSPDLTTITLPSALVLSWIENPELNAGLVIVSNDAATGQFRSSEFGTISGRPSLSLDYTVVPEPGVTGLLGVALVGFLALARRKSANLKKA